MSLLDTFVQVFEFDTSQADNAFDRVQRSTDDIIDGMKKAGQSGTEASGSISEAMSALSETLTAAADEFSDLTVTEKDNSKTKEMAAGVIKALEADYSRFIDTMRTKGIPAAIEEAKAQSSLQDALKKTDEKYQKAGESVAGFAKKALGAVGVFMSLSAIISESVSRSADIEAMDKFGKKINVATADVDAFAGSMAELGGTREAAQADMEAMAKSFGFAGNSMEKILRTADKVQGMKFDKAKATLSALGVSDDKTVELMMKGRKELERMMGVQKEYSGITKESIEQSVKFNKSMQSFKQSSGLLKNSFLEMVIPILAKGLDWLSKVVIFAKENKHLVVGFFSAIAAILLGKYIYAMKLASISTWTTLLPIIAIIAVIALLAAAFALVYDDIMNFIDGNDSMIGRILDKYPALKTIILAVWEAWKTCFEYLKAAVKVVADIVVDAYNIMNKALNDFIGWLTGSIKGVMAWGKDFGKVFSTVSDTVVGIFKWLWEQIKSYLDWIGKGLDKIKEGWATLKGWFGAGDDVEVDQTVNRTVNEQGQIGYDIPPEKTISEEDAAKMAQAMTAHLYGMSNDPMNPVTSQAISNQSATSNETNISIGELKVETQATDAQGMAVGAKDELGSQLQDLGHQTNTGLGK
ncbi:phage tail tape measure protein [Morganella morganii]